MTDFAFLHGGGQAGKGVHHPVRGGLQAGRGAPGPACVAALRMDVAHAAQ